MFPLLIALAWSDPGDTGFTSETVAVPVQGSLTDGDGLPVHGTREVTINLYDAGDTLRASQAASITFARGAFAAALDVDTEILWSVGLKLTIALDDMESDPVAVGVAPLAGVSADARRLGGWPASAFRRNHQRIAWGDVDIDDEDLRSRIYDLDDVLASECASGDTLLLGEGGQWTCVAPPDPVAAIEQATNLLFASGATLSAPGGAISTGDGEFSGTVALGGASASCGPADAGKLRWMEWLMR